MDTLRVARIVPTTTAEGPHRRFAVWMRGCSIRCPGCCNPELFRAGAPTHSVEALVAQLDRTPAVEGVTVLGGEPLEQAVALAPFLEQVRARALGVIVFTGLEYTQALRQEGGGRLLAQVDTLVDGPYRADAGPSPHRFVGSANQRLRHRTDRYCDATLWRGPRRAEIQIGPDGSVHIHGFPTAVDRLRAGLRTTQG